MRIKNNRFRAWVFKTALATGVWFILLPVCPASVAESQTDKQDIQIKQAAGVTEWPVAEKRFALIIGVSQYGDRDIAQLMYAANDADMLALTLVNSAKFSKDQVVTFSSNQRDEYQPTRNAILFHLNSMLKRMPKDGLLVVAFAGHHHA